MLSLDRNLMNNAFKINFYKFQGIARGKFLIGKKASQHINLEYQHERNDRMRVFVFTFSFYFCIIDIQIHVNNMVIRVQIDVNGNIGSLMMKVLSKKKPIK